MSEQWVGSMKLFNEEEQKQYNQERAQRLGESYSPAEDGYYSGQMGDQQQTVNQPEPMQTIGIQQAGTGRIQTEEPEPQPSQNWIAQPENFMSVWSKYDQDPDYQDEHYSREQMDMLYSVYAANNPGTTPDRWKPLMDNDPYLVGEIEKNNWWDPVKEEQKAAQQQAAASQPEVYTPENQNWIKDDMATGSWDQLDWIGKAYAATTTTNNDLENQPGYVKITQAGTQGLSSALAGPAALKIAGTIAGLAGAGGVGAVLTNPYVLLAAGVTVGGLAFYEAVSGKEMPAFDKFREISDIVDTTVEHSLGFMSQAGVMAKKNFDQAREDPNDAYGLMNAVSDTFHDVVSQAKSMWETGEYFYEMYGSIGDFTIDAMKELFKKEEGTKEGEGWFFNRGLNEKQKLAPGTYGDEGMTGLREIYQDMERRGFEKDVINAWMQEAVNRTGGTSSFVSDYVAQMALDADILLTPMQNSTMKGLSKITGNDLGVQAANINSGNVLTQLPVVGNIIQAAGQKAPGGFFEWFDIYKNLARSQDVSTLSAADRFFGGISADGTIKEFARTEKTGLSDMLPESKVAGVGNIANNVMNAYLYDTQDTADIRNRLASMTGEAEAGTEYQSGINNSAEVLTVRDGIRHAIAETNPEIILKQYDESAGARATLQKTADALGMEIKDVISLYSETPAVFEQRVRDYAAQHNGMIADIDVSGGVDPISTIVKGFSTSKDGKGTPMAWNIKQVQYQITTSMIDSMANYYTEYYGVKPNSTINTIFDTMKSAQSLLLLGWSPSYFINNVINNAVTSAAEGVLGFMTPKQIRQWMTAFGVTPARMDVDTNAEFRGQSAAASTTKTGMEAYAKGKGGLDAFTDAASKAKQSDKGLQGMLSGLNGAIRNVNNKLGVFSNLSGKMETLQGNQLTTVAIQQYWRQRWKRGAGFHLMPDSLVQTIEAQNPGMSNVVYQAIENGLSMKDVSKALFDTYVKPDAITVMKEVCADLFRGEANVYEEILEKSGVMNELRERFANCTTEEERKAVMDSVQQKLNDFIDNLRREDLIQRANNTAAVVEAEGLAPVAQMMSELEMNHQDFWIRIRREESDVMEKTQNMDAKEARALKAEVFTRHRKDFADLYKQEITTAAGIIKGLGFQNESHTKYIGYMMEANQNWVDFNELKNRELQRAYERTAAIHEATEKGKKVDRVKLNQVWDEYYERTSELYKEHFEKEMDLAAKRDAAFVEGYEFSTGKSGEEFRRNFQRIREIRQQMYDMQQDAHERARKMTPEDRTTFYNEEFNPKYNALIREIGNLGDANAQIIEDTAQTLPHAYEDHAPVNMTPEQTVQATEVMDTNNAIREKAMRERAGYLDREGIKQGWIEAGRTPAEADLMMAVFDAAAESWAKMNGAYPDEFYSQAVQLKGIAQWLPGAEQGSALNQMSANQIISIMKNSDLEYFGIRVDRAGLQIGEELANSHQWFQDYQEGWEYDWDGDIYEDPYHPYDSKLGLWDDGELPGTSTIGIDADMSEAEISNRLKEMHYYKLKDHTTIYLIGGDGAEGGNDINESIISNARVLGVIDSNALHQQAQEIVKGTFEHTDIGNIIRMLNASDVSTMVHESGHLFRRTLSQPLMQEFTTWAGFESVAEFNELEYKWRTNDPSLTEVERTRYVEAEEKFARGFEQYLMDGSAPTPGLKAVFKAFRDYLLDIYQKVKTTVTGNDYSQQGEFVFHGKTGDEVLNINAEINGVKLRDIFDRMLTDDIQRTPGYTELVQNLRDQLSQDRHNMRMSREALSRRAQVEVTRQILQSFGSMEAAEQALRNYDLPMEINGWRVDDATLFEAINAAKADAQMNPFAEVDHHEVKGTNTYAYSISDANSGKKYQMQYKVVELKDLIPSNEWFADQLVINENYPADLQGRNRGADSSDVYAHAIALNPGLLIDEQRAIDSGAPIVGEGNLYVESGNGRVLSLLLAQEKFPEQWQNYQEYLRNSVSEYGIDPEQLDSFESPVLIRERMGGDAVSFAEDANTNRNKVMTASENALTDANKVDMVTLSNLDIQPGEGIDTFTTEKNAQPAVEWLRSLPESERARYSTTNRNGDLILSSDGKTRFTNALFATLYATPESMDIIRSFSETADSNIQALESALKQTLPEMARAEGLIRSGSRAENLSITADVMAAAGLLEEARKAGINIHDYLAQQTIPGFERWTPEQALLAGFFGDAKNNVRMIRDFLNAYGEEVYKAGDPNQLSLFGESKTREQMINDSLEAALNKRQSGQGPVVSDQQATGTNRTPVLNQSSVIGSDERWSSEFAKVLDENLQRTFDDGMAVPLEQAESIYLRGDTNVKYETNVQRWLRDFSNNKNLSPDQYLYAWEYFEWWVQGSNGEAPKGNPIWEADVQKMVVQDFGSERAEMISELQRRYKRGAEVDQTAVPNSGEYFKRTYGFEHGFWTIAGNVYKDGKLVAYLPEEISQMKKTIDVDGQSYHVLGVDLQNPEGLVYYDPILEIVRTVNVGKPEGFEEPRNPFAFIRPAHQGSTPQTMPVADAYGELKAKYLDPALGAFLDKYKEADAAAKTSKMSGLDVRTRAELLKWLDTDVAEDMRQEKFRAMKYSDMKKDAAMLNYNQRYGFDPILTILSPYQFWYTRSMWKWAKRMIDKPALGNAYERLQEYEDKNRQENLPSRLSGRWRIPMPFLPDWMGGSYYVDLNAQLFPWTQFGQSYGSNMNAATLNARTQEILEQMVQSGDITAEEKQEAIEKKESAIWKDAYAEAELEIGKNDGLNTLASQFISPSIFVSWYDKKQKGEDPGTLSGTRTGNAIRALTQDIPLVSQLGDAIGDAMAIPEKALRKLYGFDFNEFGQYGDQQIRKQISQMAADGDITWQQALNAMNEKAGTIWDMAADRQRKEAALAVPGAAGVEAVKEMVKGNASVTDAIGSIAMSLMGGGKIYPEGEKTLRELKALRDQAYIDEANGVRGAVSEWYDKYGDLYTTRSATYMDDPQELLKFTLYNQINKAYYDQPYAQQQEIKNELGPEFDRALFNKDTKNYKAVPIETLAKWNAALGGKNPNVGSIDVQGVERVMQLSDKVIESVDTYYEERDRLYPGISIIQNGYRALPKDQRKSYIQSVPQLEDYWEWNRNYKNDHPEYVRWNEERSDYYNEATCYNSYAEMSERTQQQLELNKATAERMSSAAEWELQQLYTKYANENFLSFEDYIKLLQDWK